MSSSTVERCSVICAPAGRPRGGVPRFGRIGGIADRDRAQWLPIILQLKGFTNDPGAKIVDPTQQLPTPRTASATSRGLHGRPGSDGEHGVLGLGPDGVRIVVGAFGYEERNEHFRCVVEDLPRASRLSIDSADFPSAVRSWRQASFIRSRSATRRVASVSHTKRTGRVW